VRPAIWSACCVVGDDDDKQVLDGDTEVLAGPAAGGIVEIHSTVHPDTCREIAKSAADKGISVIDAPVSGGAPAVSGGHPAGDGRSAKNRAA
jgi:3-hydroxyisobutyrate dehydrogenase-like beta-hydroxyacid dehydrogenase